MSLIPRDGLVDLARQFAVDEIFCTGNARDFTTRPCDCRLLFGG